MGAQWLIVVSVSDFPTEDQSVAGLCMYMYCAVSVDMKFYPTFSLSTQVYKWVLLNYKVNLTKCWGVP